MPTHPTANDATARISAAYAKATAASHHNNRIASAFRPNKEYDRMLAVRTTDPAAWSAIPTQVRIGLAYYAAAKAAAEAPETS